MFASANTGKTAIDTVRFDLNPASTSSGPVDLSSTGTVLTYLDEKGWFLYQTDEFNGCQRYCVMEPKAGTGNTDLPF